MQKIVSQKCVDCRKDLLPEAFGSRIKKRNRTPPVCLECKPIAVKRNPISGTSTGKRAPGKDHYPCARCSKELPEADFCVWSNRGRATVFSYCRRCSTTASRENWRKHHPKLRRMAKHPYMAAKPGPKAYGNSKAVVEEYESAINVLGMSEDQALRFVSDAFHLAPAYVKYQLLPKAGTAS